MVSILRGIKLLNFKQNWD